MNVKTKLRGAVIGCGYVSQYHLAAWNKIADAEIVAICDLDAAKHQTATAIIPNARPYANAEQMLAQERLDFVEICTRPPSHVELVKLAARFGAQVLCQKPVSFHRHELLEMIEACDAGSVRFMVHENWRSRPWYRAIRAAIEAGTIGRPIRLRIAHRETRALRENGYQLQPYFSEMERLILVEMGPHLIDTARYLMGDITTVTATTARFGDHSIGEDLATLMLRFESEAMGLLDMTWCAAADTARPEWALNETVVEGTKGVLRLQTDGHLLFVDLSGKSEILRVELPSESDIYLQGYKATQEHFIAGLINGQPHETSGRDTLKTMDVIWSAYESAATGRSMQVPSLKEF
jgi:predicted dehydrogenase